MKGRRKQMRKAIRDALPDRTRPWLEIVASLEAKGIPLNMILKEANEYGLSRMPNASRQGRREGDA